VKFQVVTEETANNFSD